jgi:predicted metal-dependent phosphoesterase TrpH
MLKVELHAHSNLDPHDRIPHSTHQLVDRAAALGYGALAVTCHDHYFDPAADTPYARERGIVLIAGVERTIGGRHVLLLNFPVDCEKVRTFDDIRRLKTSYPRGLVIVPHPFYPIPSAIGRRIDRHADLFDAVEVNAFYLRQIDFNTRARVWAAAHGKPLVGNGDIHDLRQLGSTYTLVDADPDAAAICDAIRAGRTEVHSRPLGILEAARLAATRLYMDLHGRPAHSHSRAPGLR